MIKEIETTKLMTSVEKDGKVVGLYFESELPPLEMLYQEYGKKNVNTMEIKLKNYVSILSDKELRRRGIWGIDGCAVPQDGDGEHE